MSMENGESTQKYSYTYSSFFQNRLRVLESARNVHKNDRTS